jgi:predicted YcjX-like family ATPase
MSPTNTEPATPASIEPTEPLSIEEIAHRIQLIRGQRVVLDADLAAFYGETTKRFNQQVRRNLARFPADFMLQLDDSELAALRLQFATLKSGRGQHIKYLPLVFTEHGAIMAATLLNSPRATAISVHVVRAFVELRAMLASNQALAQKVNTLERKVSTHERNIAELADSMAQLLHTPAEPAKRPIGFITTDDSKSIKNTGSKGQEKPR